MVPYCICVYIQQAIEDQLSYEEATRKTLSDLNEKLSNMVAIFKVAQGEMLIQHIPALSKAVLGSLSSPLATVHCWQLWSILCHSIFTEWSLGQYNNIIYNLRYYIINHV